MLIPSVMLWSPQPHWRQLVQIPLTPPIIVSNSLPIINHWLFPIESPEMGTLTSQIILKNHQVETIIWKSWPWLCLDIWSWFLSQYCKCFLLSFSFDWEDILIQDSFSTKFPNTLNFIETPWLHFVYVWYLQLFSWCLEMWLNTVFRIDLFIDVLHSFNDCRGLSSLRTWQQKAFCSQLQVWCTTSSCSRKNLLWSRGWQILWQSLNMITSVLLIRSYISL